MKTRATKRRGVALAAALGLIASTQAQAGDVFVHLFEWNWNEIANECETFLGPKGFDAVQISPPNEHVVHDTWWARYQPVSYKLDSRSGTEAELQDMIDRCRAAGVKIYADMVINHTAALNGGGTGTAGTTWSYENHPGLYSPNDYHDPRYTIGGYGDPEHVWNGRLLELPDLNTGSDHVQDQINGYFQRLQNMGVEGFRVDAAKHMSPEDVQAILSRAGNPWTFLEVIGAGGEAAALQPDRYDDIAHVTEFKYATDVASNFNGQIKHLETLGESWGLLPSDRAIVFVTNHDRERGHGGAGTLTYRDGDRYDLAFVYMLAHPYGIAKVHTGYAFEGDGQGRPGGATQCDTSGWLCQHRRPAVANMVGFSNFVQGTGQVNWWDNGSNAIAFGRGDKGFVVINNESDNLEETLVTGLPAGQYCNVLAGADPCSGLITVAADGTATFSVGPNKAAAIHGGAVRVIPGPVNQKPVATIAETPPQVAVGTTVTLDASASTDDKGIVRFAWSTGESTESITRTLNTAGPHTFSVTVTDDQGETDTAGVTILAGDKPLERRFESLFFRGTPNNWGTLEMKLVADHTWSVVVHFDGQPEQRFKVDVGGDWAHNYGDDGADGTLDQPGGDIFTGVTGQYVLEVDDEALTYSLTPAGCNQAPAAVLAPTIASVQQGGSVSFDAFGSSDVDGDIVAYRWSHGGTTGPSTSITFEQPGSETVTLTITDDRGKTARASASVTVDPVQPDGFLKVFDSLNFRGTPNDWDNTVMRLVADHIWEAEIDFDGQAQQRFKFDVGGDWSHNYGDTGGDGRLDRMGADIYFDKCGRYRVQVNDDNKIYTLTEVGAAGSCSGRQPSEADTPGAVHEPGRTIFSIWSPDHDDVKVRIDGQVHTLRRVEDFDRYSDVYQVVVEGDLHLKEYTFLIDDKEVRDPYGKMIKPQSQANIVMDMSRTDPAGGWAPHPHFLEREDAVIYEVHVRDFTIDASSGVAPEKRGKYLGLVEGGTRHEGAKTGIDHLLELGVTHVQLLPIYDFATCDGLPDSDACYNWGYDPRNYNLPDERYSLTPSDYENRVRELKEMINALHKAGIRVVMDVVYNHTFGNEMFEDITDKYFYHQDLVVGNTIDDGVPMVSRMIEDSLLYWAQEYHIDGFRFDLVGIFGYDNFGKWARRLSDELPGRNILMYGEPWPGCFGCVDEREHSRVRLGTIARVHDAHVGVFNPKYREALKGKNDSGGCNPGDCYVFNNDPDAWRIGVGSRGAVRFANDPGQQIDTWDPMFAADPEQSINYVSAHDNLTLRDKILAWADANGRDRSDPFLRRIQNFASGIVLTSQGIPFLHGGVELMRDKKGEHNSYDAGDEINRYQWQWKVDNADVFDYSRAAIAMRNAHPGFRMNTWEEIDDNVDTSFPRHGVVVSHINGAANGDPWKEILVIYNSADNYTHQLPEGDWKVAMEKGAGPTADNHRGVSGSVVAEGTAVTVLYKE
ncbi:MAG: alpha-amylase family glycosyl hydrolase [Candidatus Krumholzibacteria bacterium]|nr:alpha-amylase family glycosyl hydrolase [Candidatus Krumholzibacteria bacterium]